MPTLHFHRLIEHQFPLADTYNCITLFFIRIAVTLFLCNTRNTHRILFTSLQFKQKVPDKKRYTYKYLSLSAYLDRFLHRCIKCSQRFVSQSAMLYMYFFRLAESSLCQGNRDDK